MASRQGALQVKVDEGGRMDIRWVGQLTVVEAAYAALLGVDLLKDMSRRGVAITGLESLDQRIEDSLRK